MSFMLSENGWRKAEKHLCPECWGENNWTTSDEPIFEQDDLQGMVVLTAEEAKTLLECACCVDAYTFAKCKKLFNCLKTRIELVENEQ